MPVDIVGNDILDRIYRGCVDTETWDRMLGDVALILGADEIAYCPDITLPLPERSFNASYDAICTEREYSAVLDQAFQDTPLDDEQLFHKALDGEGSDRWLVLRDARMRKPSAFLLRREGVAFVTVTTASLESITDHLFRTAQLRAQIERSMAQARTAIALLDLLRTPVFLVDARLTVVLSNAAARKLERSGVVAMHRQRLSFQSTESMRRAEEAVLGSGQGGSIAQQERLIRIEQPDGRLLLAVVEPLDGLFPDRDQAPDAAVAAIFLKDPERPVHSVEAVMRTMHDMPPAEARFAAALADGKTIKQYAIEADLSEAYVRDLSKRVMQRLGVQRQQQLVRAIIQMTPELGG